MSPLLFNTPPYSLSSIPCWCFSYAVEDEEEGWEERLLPWRELKAYLSPLLLFTPLSFHCHVYLVCTLFFCCGDQVEGGGRGGEGRLMPWDELKAHISPLLLFTPPFSLSSIPSFRSSIAGRLTKVSLSPGLGCPSGVASKGLFKGVQGLAPFHNICQQ